MGITLKAFREWLGVQEAPSAELVDDFMTKVKALLERLSLLAAGPLADRVGRLALIEAGFNEVKGKIPLKGEKTDPDLWKAKPETERREIGIALEGVLRELMCMNRDELTVGRRYFLVFFGLLFVLGAVYLIQHSLSRSEDSGAVRPEQIIEAAKQLRTIELEIRILRKLKTENKPLPSNAFEKLTAAVKEMRSTTRALDLSASALQLLGALEAETGRIEITESETVVKLDRILSAELESLRSAFLWNDRQRRWYEIAWWAELGTLVGILFYIAGGLSAGRFQATEIPMFWTEVVVAPLVVLVIFFLFSFTGITGILPQETSITGNAGFAFIIGFAIRRTMGLFDTLKKRIFPDPTPAS